MYTDTFVKSKEVSINFDAFDVIPKFLIKDTNIEEFEGDFINDCLFVVSMFY